MMRSPSTPRRPLDPLAWVAAALLLVALGAATVAALHGPLGAPALLLLAGLAGFMLIAVFAFGPAAARTAPPGPDAARLIVSALLEPAAVACEDGRVIAYNDAWRAAWAGEGRRLPRTKGAAGLYGALTQACREGKGEAQVVSAHGAACVHVSRLSGDQLLLRLTPELPAATSGVASAPTIVQPALATPSRGPPPAAAGALEAFGAAAPFGAALVEGADPFAGRILQVNGALVAMTEGAATVGRVFGELIEPAVRAEARARLAARPDAPAEVRLALAKPTIAHLYIAGGEAGLVVYLLDVSEQKQLELQLGQSQKMQAIGQLAGGVAHDFNNLLTAIQLRLDELLHRHPVGDPSYEGLNEIRQTAVRAADLVRKLLAFSRKQTVQRETLELGSLMSEFEVLLRRLLREDVKLVTDYGRDPPTVRADRSQLETAVINLAVNARDALRSHGSADGGPGVVRIRTGRMTQAEARAAGYAGAAPEGSALIEVADNGPGIPPGVADKIFEPFFTTKPVGEGTGLGLATVYGIVKQADGWIHVDSAPDRGAAFRIFLPIHVPVAGSPPAPKPEPKPKPAARDLSGAGRILFVEDEDAVRVVAARLLRARGYEVLEACDGEEALELCELHAGKIDLLISDVIMPGLDGPTLLKKARSFLDGAKVMFISGYAEAEFSNLLEGEEGVTFLPKPIDIKILAERVKQQLAG